VQITVAALFQPACLLGEACLTRTRRCSAQLGMESRSFTFMAGQYRARKEAAREDPNRPLIRPWPRDCARTGYDPDSSAAANASSVRPAKFRSPLALLKSHDRGLLCH
jgi:hypothetical protein